MDGIERLRRIAVRAQLLDGSATDALSTVRRLGFLQMDPIATVAPPQHLVLFNRVPQYDPAELDRLVWQERRLFEWSAFLWPVEDAALVHARMRRRRATANAWTREFFRETARLRHHVLRELERNGPLLSGQLGVERPQDAKRHTWWGSGDLRLLLDLLGAHGHIGVAGRVGRQRLWDLGERVYPHAERIPWRDASHELEDRRRRSLGVWLERGKLHVHRDADDGPVPRRIAFLSPFDRLVHDRARAEALFGFRYRLEMYVPKAKREYGYYVLPILHGARIAGRIDVRRDREAGGLRVDGVWWEPGRKPLELGPALRRLERFVARL